MAKPFHSSGPLTVKVVSAASQIELGFLAATTAEFVSPLLQSGQLRVRGFVPVDVDLSDPGQASAIPMSIELSVSRAVPSG